MIRRKLTPSLKKKIKNDFKNLRLRDFDGEALAYLRKVKSASNAKTGTKPAAKKKTQKKKASKEKTPKKKKVQKSEEPIKIAGKIIKPGSEAYELIQTGAKAKNQTVKKFVRENEEAISRMLENYLIFFKKEIDDLIKFIRELPDGSKIFSPIKHKKISRSYVIYLLHAIKKAMLETSLIYEVVFIEYALDLYGNLHVNVPRPGEYAELGGDDLLEFIDDRYANITYIRND